MIARFQNSSLMEKEGEYRPLLFFSEGSDRGKPEPFPIGRGRGGVVGPSGASSINSGGYLGTGGGLGRSTGADGAIRLPSVAPSHVAPFSPLNGYGRGIGSSSLSTGLQMEATATFRTTTSFPPDYLSSDSSSRSESQLACFPYSSNI